MFRNFFKPRSTSALPSYTPDVISAVLASLSDRSFPLTPERPGQYIYRKSLQPKTAWLCASGGSPFQTPPFAAGSLSVRIMACVIFESRYEANHCITCVTASTSMVRLEVVTLWAPLSSCTAIPPCLTVNPQPDRSLVTEPSVRITMSCGVLMASTRICTSALAFPAGN